VSEKKRFAWLRGKLLWSDLWLLALGLNLLLLGGQISQMGMPHTFEWWFVTAGLTVGVIGTTGAVVRGRCPAFRYWWRGIDWVNTIARVIKITIFVVMMVLGIASAIYSHKFYYGDYWCWWWTPFAGYILLILAIYAGKRVRDYCLAKKTRWKIERSAIADRREALTELGVGMMRVAASKPRTLVYKPGEAAELHAMMMRVIDTCACTVTERGLIMSAAAERFAKIAPATATANEEV